MPRELADVQVVSRMPVPSSMYSSRSSHLYSSTSSLRSTSLDRRSATLRESSSSSSSSTSSSSYISRLPPRPSFEHRSKVVSDLPRLSSRVVLDVSSGSRRSLTRQRSGDAISDAGSPVLTRYRDLGTDSPSSRASSPARRLLDENCNRASTPTRRLDWNHNVYNGSGGGSHSLPPDSPGRDSGASISPASSRHWRNLGSSTSSVDSGGSSSSDCSPGLRRARRLSLTSEESSSGVSVGSSRSRDHLDKAPLGLRNLGNTCFMNSIVQCLAHTRPLLEYCLKDGYVSEINSSTSSMKGALFEAFATLMKSIWRCSNGEYAISPQAFRSQIQKFAPRFMGYSQQDSQEFLHYLLQGLHEDINRITSRPRHLTTEIDDNLSESQKAAEAWKRYLRYDDSKIVDCFVGQLKSTLKCSVCGHKSVTFDPFWDLSLPIPKSSDPVTIQQCLSLFTKEEVLDGDEKPTCSHCKTRQKCTKSFTIHRCPKILVLHLKRFSPSERFRAKLNTRIEFPLTNLDLCPYMSNSHYVMYNLYAVSNHSGSTYSGHYTASCLHPKSGEWHECNDTKVSEVSASRVVSSEAYVLFYEAATQSSRL
ncbi:ubiquitin carboxyl-terminal hydrolase 2-like [Dermacentor andersoni]|uniref:ubiquitin carboxyl-terminal hydrolase 2-like n=1 Tax=Dermacentor andersoni TaxID=34620 RepID=UPI0021555A58|nr:ubiquitin carboxyl-terminal hydrolase 2-like [Dermacentor andersoni]XP_050034497.1 ubiquitin carboxyl-terminal hydrolase 2-like [Dermacentor andersoni]